MTLIDWQDLFSLRKSLKAKRAKNTARQYYGKAVLWIVKQKTRIYEDLIAIVSAPEDALDEIASRLLAEDVVYDVAHPVNQLVGRQAVLDGFYRPLRAALHETRRRDEIFISAPNRRDFGGEWISAVTHYVGNFQASLFGVRPHDSLAFLRSGEFYQIKDGQITLARLIPDFIDLMRQARRLPIDEILGTEILFPGLPRMMG